MTLANHAPSNNIYQPLFYNLNNSKDKEQYNLLLKSERIYIHDEIEGQLKELIKCLNPSIKIDENNYPELIKTHIAGQSLLEYGLWIYYPWSNKLLHTLNEEEFIEVRTNRNRNKITKEEQNFLRTKKIGIVGLSVGQSIALTIAMERTCGELRLADFDTAELSNINRLRTGLHNLGVKKTVIAAREILEIDPFIKIKIFNEGLNQNNMDDFFTQGGKLDLCIEVCDGINIKIDSRFKARELGIPVVMDTNDRGMLDIERFDLEPRRDIFHGLINSYLKDNAILPDINIMKMLMDLVSFESASDRLKVSMNEIGKTITTWPQLASSVVLGGSITTDISRKILLKQHSKSGRYYIDLDKLFNT